MRAFTYFDYIYYRKIFVLQDKISSTYRLNDDYEEYELMEKKDRGKTIKQDEVLYPHDKIFKDVFDDKIEAVDFINERLELKNTENSLHMNDIEKYNRQFITYDFSNMESDIIYKVKNKKIFFLIEHQSTIDYSMPYRILRYNMAIMESAVDKKKVKNKNYKLPLIFSFVIYTGRRKWNANTYLIEKQEKLDGCDIQPFAGFQVIDINDYTKKQLLDSNNVLSIAMLMEKVDNMEEVLQNMLHSGLNERQREFLRRILNYIFINKDNKIVVKKYLKILERSEGDNNMFVEIVNNWIDEMVEKEMNLKQKEDELVQKNKKLIQKDKKLIQKDKKLIQKDKKLIQKDKKLIQKDKKLIQKEKNVEQKEKEVEKKEKNVQMIEKNMKDKIKLRELEVKKREQNLNMQTSNLIKRAIKVGISEDKILEIVEINKDEFSKIKSELNNQDN